MNVIKLAKMTLAAAVVAANLGMVAPDHALAMAGNSAINSYSFGVEREMKESGEKGGPQASTTRDTAVGDTAVGDKVVVDDDNVDERMDE